MHSEMKRIPKIEFNLLIHKNIFYKILKSLVFSERSKINQREYRLSCWIDILSDKEEMFIDVINTNDDDLYEDYMKSDVYSDWCRENTSIVTISGDQEDRVMAYWVEGVIVPTVGGIGLCGELSVGGAIQNINVPNCEKSP